MYADRILNALRKKVADVLTDKHNELGGGSKLVADDAAATGMACAKVMGEISGLKTTLFLIEETEREFSGKKKGIE